MIRWCASVAILSAVTALGIRARAAEPQPAASDLPPAANANGEAPDWHGSAADSQRPTRLYGSAEYLFWWIKSDPLPVPLATSVPASLIKPPSGLGSGTLADPNASVVLGGHDLGANQRNGGRFTIGGYLDGSDTLAVEGSYFFLSSSGHSASVSGSGAPGTPGLFVPFYDAIGKFTGTGQPGLASEIIAFPAGVSAFQAIPGGEQVTATDHLQGAELNGVWNVLNTQTARIGLLAGLRYLELDEGLDFQIAQVVERASDVANDVFETENRFFGGQLGLRAEVSRGRYFLRVEGKMALGSMQQDLDINGLDFRPSGVVPQGFFAETTNSGQHTHSAFCVIPEATLNVGVNLTRHISATVGYDFLSVNQVVRPGDQIDPVLNVSQRFNGTLVGPARPAVNFNATDFWAQGINFGILCRF